MLNPIFLCFHQCMQMYTWLRQGLTLAGVSLAVSESDQRCLSWEELGTHSQNVCVRQTHKATSVGVCSHHMCSQACRHMWTNPQRGGHRAVQKYKQRDCGTVFKYMITVLHAF